MGKSNQFNKIVGFLNIDNTLSINRSLAHSIGLEETVMYQALVAKYAYYLKAEQLSADRWFYSTINDLEESTTFSGKTQRRIADKLCKLNLIEKKLDGMPRKTFYRIVEDSELIFDFISKGEEKASEIKRQNIKKEENNADKASNNHCSAQREQQVVPNGNNKQCQTGTTSSAKREQQAVPDGNNKQFPTGQTSSAQREHKTKDNKLKKETKEKKDVLLTNHSFIQDISSLTNESDGKNERKISEKAKMLIEYDYLITNYPEHNELTKAILNIMIQILACEDEYITFGNNQKYVTIIFQSRIMSLNSDMIIAIFDKFDNLEEKIINPVPYLAAVLYNETVQYNFRCAEEYRDCI